MQFNTIPAELSKDLAFCEKKLRNAQFLGGASPTQLDSEYLAKLKPHVALFSALSHPHTFGWFCLASKYAEPVTKTWA
jgi:hypothetical protein